MHLAVLIKAFEKVNMKVKSFSETEDLCHHFSEILVIRLSGKAKGIGDPFPN